MAGNTTNKRNLHCEKGAIWHMKKRGSVGVQSPVPNCGYDQKTLESLRKAGWHLYDGEKKIW